MPQVSMSSDRRKALRKDYPKRLAELRSKIESLPEQQRPFFHSAVDDAEHQHNRMQKQCASIRDLDADLGLIVAHAKFHVAACRRELRQLDPHERFQI